MKTGTKTTLSEHLPKAVREKLYEKYRITDKDCGRKSLRIAKREPVLATKILPRKETDHSSIPRFRQKRRKKFMGLKSEDRNLLIDILNHMISVSIGGWRKDGDRFVNESGRIAGSGWSLNGDRLVLKNGKNVDIDADKIHQLREMVEYGKH